jgi:adenine phosphoribosyltransferase
VRRAADLVETLTDDRPLRLLTHCNTGRLATAAVGTALGTILELAARGRVAEVLVDETRPLLQGSQLTAWELGEAGVPYRLCVDCAAAPAMERGLVDCILVGADRIAVNGDTANKIGTYGLAVTAARHHIPFVVVAPESSWDPQLADGTGIVVEERDPGEVSHYAGLRVGPEGAEVFNPAFDVTPAELITALVTEERTVRPRPSAVTAPTGIAVARTGPSGPLAERIRRRLTTVPDFPFPGVQFQDLADVYAEPGLLADIADEVARFFADGFDRVVAVESRGFLVGAALSARTGTPLTVARKPGKLPGPVHRAHYDLEYGSDGLDLQKDAIRPGESVLCVDDVLATGGTLDAAAQLVKIAGGRISGMAVVVGLSGLGGNRRLTGQRLLTLCEVS